MGAPVQVRDQRHLRRDQPARAARDTAGGVDITAVWGARQTPWNNETRSAEIQGGYQLAALATTLCFSITAGLLAGFILRYFERPDWKDSCDSNEWQHCPTSEANPASED